MMRPSLFLSIIFILTLSGCAGPSKQKSDDTVDMHESLGIDVQKKILPNGLKILVVENHDLPIFSYYTYFDVGGRYEKEGTTGATHFLEHMMFKGAKKFGPGEFDRFIESNGGQTNAYTTFDNTVYHQQLPSDALEMIIEMESDRIAHLLLEENGFEKERAVVLEERKMRYENSPGGKIHLKMMQEAFKGTPYGGSVIGEKKDVENLNREQMREFFHRFYTPDNATIVVVGDVDAANVFRLVEEKFGLIASSRGLGEYKKILDHQDKYKFMPKESKSININGTSPTPMFRISFNAPKVGTRESYVLDILSSILGNGESSHLSKIYVKSKRPFLSEVFSFNYSLMHSGVFVVGGQLVDKVSINKFENTLRRDLSLSCKTSIDERSLQKTKNQFLIGHFGNLQSNSGVAGLIGDYEFFYKDYTQYLKAIEIYNDMQVAEVQTACMSLFSGPGIFISLWNKHPEKK